MAFATPHDTSATGNGTTLTLDSVGFTVTNIVISNTNPGAAGDNLIDVAHLGQSTGELAARLTPPLVIPAEDGGSGRQVTFDYLGNEIINDGSNGTYEIKVAGVTLLGGSASFFTVQSSTLTLATNDAIRGQAVLSISR